MQPGGRADHEQRHERQRVAPREPPALPPQDQEDRGRQRARDRLARERREEQDERERVEGPRAWRAARGIRAVLGRLEAQVRQQRAQVAHARQHVLALGDPGHRLDVHRVHGEQRRREPGAWDAQPPQREPGEQRHRGVQQHVGRVVAGRRELPQPVLEPERGVDQRVVLRDRARLGPDARQTLARAQRGVLGDVLVVVPDPAGAERRHVGGERQEQQAERRQQAAPGRRRARRAGCVSRGHGRDRIRVTREPVGAKLGRCGARGAGPQAGSPGAAAGLARATGWPGAGPRARSR